MAPTAFVSVTRLRVRSPRFLPAFLWFTWACVRQARRSRGCRGAAVRRTGRLAFWTLSAWEDEAAMSAFREQSPHRETMPKLARWCDEASVAHWIEDSGDWLSWERAAQRLVAHGRLSRVDHPSRAQAEGRLVAT